MIGLRLSQPRASRTAGTARAATSTMGATTVAHQAGGVMRQADRGTAASNSVGREVGDRCRSLRSIGAALVSPSSSESWRYTIICLCIVLAAGGLCTAYAFVVCWPLSFRLMGCQICTSKPSSPASCARCRKMQRSTEGVLRTTARRFLFRPDPT